MFESWTRRLDQFGRRHPGWMFAFTLLVAILTTFVLLVVSQDQKILYKAF